MKRIYLIFISDLDTRFDLFAYFSFPDPRCLVYLAFLSQIFCFIERNLLFKPGFLTGEIIYLHLLAFYRLFIFVNKLLVSES